MRAGWTIVVVILLVQVNIVTACQEAPFTPDTDRIYITDMQLTEDIHVIQFNLTIYEPVEDRYDYDLKVAEFKLVELDFLNYQLTQPTVDSREVAVNKSIFQYEYGMCQRDIKMRTSDNGSMQYIGSGSALLDYEHTLAYQSRYDPSSKLYNISEIGMVDGELMKNTITLTQSRLKQELNKELYYGKIIVPLLVILSGLILLYRRRKRPEPTAETYPKP